MFERLRAAKPARPPRQDCDDQHLWDNSSGSREPPRHTWPVRTRGVFAHSRPSPAMVHVTHVENGTPLQLYLLRTVFPTTQSTSTWPVMKRDWWSFTRCATCCFGVPPLPEGRVSRSCVPVRFLIHVHTGLEAAIDHTGLRLSLALSAAMRAIAAARSLPSRAYSSHALAAASTRRLLRRADNSAEPLPHHALLVRSMGQRPNETLEEELQRLAGYAQTSVSLKATLDTGLGLLLPESEGGGLDKKQHILIQIASFLRREMPVRLARRAVELHNLPEGLHGMPSVVRVREWYEQSFVELRRSQQPVDAATEQVGTASLQTHRPSVGGAPRVG